MTLVLNKLQNYQLTMGLDIKIISLNVVGLLSIDKHKRIAKYLKQQRADIVCLQETHLKPTESKLSHYLFRGDIYQSFSAIDLLVSD